MFYKIVLFITFFSTLISAETLLKVTPTATKIILETQKKANLCSNPSVANEKLTDNFKYGCFCGKDYPELENNTTDDFRKLSKDERRDEMLHLYSIKPYDDIDALCQEHDICYLYYGKKAKVCNDTIYEKLYSLAKTFNESNQTLHNEQCYNLATDMASVFKTLFALSDDEDTIFDFGMALFNTGVTVTNKGMQESMDTMTDHDARYPQAHTQCRKRD